MQQVNHNYTQQQDFYSNECFRKYQTNGSIYLLAVYIRLLSFAITRILTKWAATSPNN